MSGNVERIGYVEEDTRWKATITYRVTEYETRSEVHHIWELEQLQDIVENGPTFCAIEDFRIEYCGPKETIEQASNS